MQHEGGPREGDATSYMEQLHAHGSRVRRYEVRPFSYPKWAVFRTHRLYPKPQFWCDIWLEREGREGQIFLALAHDASGYRTSYYVEAKTRPVRKLDLRVEREKVERFLVTAGHALAKLPLARPIELVELAFSVEEGYATVSVDTENGEPGRIVAFPEFKRLVRWAWAGFEEMGEILIDLDGRAFARDDANRWGAPAAPLIDIVGMLFVEATAALRDRGGMAAWRLSASAQFGVHEIDGRFSFPHYEERGRENWLVAPA